MNTKHLKAKILDLAIRGKLVPQDPSEGNAADLLQKIRDEKGGESLPLAAAGKPSSATPSPRGFTPKTPKTSSSCLNNSCEFFEEILVSERKRTTNPRSKNASFIIKADDGRHYEQFADGSLKDIEDEIPFEIPKNWCWCRLKDLCIKIGSGSTPLGSNYAESGVLFFRSQNVQNYGLVFKDIKYITDEIHRSMISTEVVSNDLLLNITGGSIGRCAVVPSDFLKGNVSQHVCILRVRQNLLLPNYLHRFILSPAFQTTYETTGSGRPGLPKYNLEKMLLPLPPLSEQKRIVSAIEKAFEQIDIIEKNKLNLKTYIKQTKSKVLDLAIHGKLVEQNPQEGNAFELLEKIRREKAELIEQKKLKEDKNASFIIKAEDGKHYEQFADGSLKDVEEEIPFEIPENWCWCRLDSIATIERGGSPRPISHFLTKNKDGVNWIKIGDTKKGDKYIENVKEKIIPEGIRHSRLVHAGDFLLTNSMSFGRPYILKVDGCIHDGWLVFGDIYPCITSDFLFQLLSSPFIYESFTLTAAGSTVKNLNIDRVKQVMFPLPPLSEQKRIVAKIEQVFEQLDRVEKALGE